ncbi:MrpF/PhaF family protein [Streptacidiphilus griseoplanus]|uniref:MrpF/PhaF family protein n=1 Tax=Peterkaempfera griseoplana TaxID=66896 RepID=UPI0006E42A06|nr:MrpF/PhaF family protein [Peterkaempfera griseoplana]
MNAWLSAALVLLAAAAPLCLWEALHGSAVQRLAAVSLLGTVAAAVFLLLPQGFARPAYQDAALLTAVLAPAGTLVFARFVADADPGSGSGSERGPSGTDGTGGDAAEPPPRPTRRRGHGNA